MEDQQPLWKGSIPALAGERPRFIGRTATYWVYPRACGGTIVSSHVVKFAWGLSPRLRGNVAGEALRGSLAGSIPALAGERWLVSVFRDVDWVYPRACGGTLWIGPGNAAWTGLSPRLRGNG